MALRKRLDAESVTAFVKARALAAPAAPRLDAQGCSGCAACACALRLASCRAQRNPKASRALR
jgi:hypothetical protein